MANKKNKPTFASRAKGIINKYKRANWDPIEKEQLDKELATLAQEQEQYRQANGMNDSNQKSQQQYANGGLTDYLNADYDEGMIPIEPWMTDVNSFQSPQVDMTSTSAGMLPTSGLSNYSTSIIPSIASGAITAGANMFMANRAMRDIPEMSLNRLSPEEISLARERSGVQRQSSTAGRIARSNAARGSRTRGEYLSTAAAQEAAMNRGTAEALSGLYSQEARMNAAERARVSEANARLQAQEAQANFMAQQQARANRDAYTSAAIQAIPQTMMNVAGIRQQDALINSLGQDYSIGQYQDPSLNWFQKITQPKQIVRRYKG